MPNGRSRMQCGDSTDPHILEEFSTLAAAHTMHNLHAQASSDAELFGRDLLHRHRNTPGADKTRGVPPSSRVATGVGNASAGRADATTERADQRHAVRLLVNNGHPQPSRPAACPMRPLAARPPAAAPRFPGPLRPTAPAPAASPKTRTAAPARGRPRRSRPLALRPDRTLGHGARIEAAARNARHREKAQHPTSPMPARPAGTLAPNRTIQESPNPPHEPRDAARRRFHQNRAIRESPNPPHEPRDAARRHFHPNRTIRESPNPPHEPRDAARRHFHSNRTIRESPNPPHEPRDAARRHFRPNRTIRESPNPPHEPRDAASRHFRPNRTIRESPNLPRDPRDAARRRFRPNRTVQTIPN